MRLEVIKFAKLKEEILHAKNVTQLRSLRNQFQRNSRYDVEQMQLSEDIAIWNEQINEIHDAFIRRTITIAELSMVGEGYGPPPTSYSYLLLGSGGRSEQTLASDQDSGIIYEERIGSQQSDKHYFLQFTQKIIKMLMDLGYPPCEGKVQSNEELWCQSDKEWKDKLEHWFDDATWESIRYLLIFADARCVVGDDFLFREVRNYYEQGLIRHASILERMIENTVQYKMLVGVFGQFLTDRYGENIGNIDVKYGAYIPFVNSIRWLALNSEIGHTSTLKRIQMLLDREIISEEEHSQYRAAFLQMLSLRLRAGYLEVEDYFEGKNKIHPKSLTSEEIKGLKRSLRIGKEIQRQVMREFGKQN